MIVMVASRIVIRRVFGKLAFMKLQDAKGFIQLYFDAKMLVVEHTDAGDIIGVTGHMKRTDKGELSIVVHAWHMLTKSLHPLPDKHHGLHDISIKAS